MKTRMFAIVIVLFLAVSLSFAEDKITIEDTYCAWVNADYNERSESALIIFNPDGSAAITDSWHDEDGNLWIKREGSLVYWGRPHFYYWLEKYSSDGSVWESVWRGSGYPTEMSLIGGNYGIHYRQE
jgi:hypothetical protein